MIEERIKQIITTYGLTAGGFADILGIQASGISHILSGRNKPSLDFVTRVLTKFPDISWNWLVLGKGSMQSLEVPVIEEPSLFSQEPPQKVEEVKTEVEPEPLEEVFEEVEEPPVMVQEPVNEPEPKSKGRIRRIIVFYDDCTYEEVSN
ncbi:MAG: helix-turn-helix domain-containing protein [Bacteroidales bacterium]|jgi:transcriptional regulator with XRE-family HTH domain|nr:helix-turn-helix domain-containing protein [Bacteroidales bacterium]